MKLFHHFPIPDSFNWETSNFNVHFRKLSPIALNVFQCINRRIQKHFCNWNFTWLYWNNATASTHRNECRQKNSTRVFNFIMVTPFIQLIGVEIRILVDNFSPSPTFLNNIFHKISKFHSKCAFVTVNLKTKLSARVTLYFQNQQTVLKSLNF